MESSAARVDRRPGPELGIAGSASRVDPAFAREIAAVFGQPNLSLCYQCGMCSASCPTFDRMRYGPRKLMHMVHLGMGEAALRSPDIWLCVSCYSCTSRCPQNVPITEVIATLRSMAIARGLARDREATFSRIFVQVLARYGRMFEPEVLLRYDATGVSPGELLRQAGLGLRMLRKGKIGLHPERIEHPDSVSDIVAWARGGENA